MKRLAELASEISSKNAGNFYLTFDVVFEDKDVYERIKHAKVLTPEGIAARYPTMSPNEIAIIEFDEGCAFKIAVRRARPSGSIGETDVFGAQQYAPLLDIEVPD